MQLYHFKWSLLFLAAAVLQCSRCNVLLLMVDDLRPTLGCYGDGTAITPSIDALAASGVQFNRAYTQQALCGPSRTSLLTSRRPSSTHVVDVHTYWRNHANFSTLPQIFREHGYYTSTAGKIFHPGIVSNFSDDAKYSWSAVPYHPSTEHYKNAPVCGPHKNSTDIVCPVLVDEQPEGSLPDLQTTHYALSFLYAWKQRQEAGEGGKPFFLAVGFHKPHIPLKYPKQFLDLYPLPDVPLPPNGQLPPGLPSVAYNPWNDLRRRDDITRLNLSFPYQPIPDDYARLIIQSYYAATSYMDMLVGQVLALAATLFPDTIVLLVSDHGWSLGEHQEWSKYSNYEIATRVPMLVARLTNYTQARQRALFSRQKREKLKRYVAIQGELRRNFNSWAGVGQQQGIYEEHWNFKDFLQNPRQKRESSNSVDDEGNTVRRGNGHLYIEEQRQRYSDLPNSLERETENDEESSAAADQSIEHIGSPFRINFTYNGIVELLDVFPTLVDLAGLKKVPPCDLRHESQYFNIGQKDSKEAILCTEGKSLSSIIIDNNAEQKVRKSKEVVQFSMIPSVPHEATPTDENLEAIAITRQQRRGLEFKNITQLSTLDCITDLMGGRIAVSQYPRPSLTPSKLPDSDQCRLSETIVMGYSMRSLCFRYTLWVAFNSSTFSPDFAQVFAEELYDHRTDPEENRNIMWGANTEHGGDLSSEDNFNVMSMKLEFDENDDDIVGEGLVNPSTGRRNHDWRSANMFGGEHSEHSDLTNLKHHQVKTNGEDPNLKEKSVALARHRIMSHLKATRPF
uniref:Iduronate 2-sulfatase-like n=1 Tax=Hirondellea gigas TaxID=1518452 RepID=A0A6A7FN98_9CRUS